MPDFKKDPTGFRMKNSGLNMGAKHGTPIQKNYGKGMPLTEGGKKAIMASDANPGFKAAIAKADVDSPADMHSPAKNKDVTEEYKTKGNENTKAHIKAGGSVIKDKAGRLVLSKTIKKK